MLRSNLEAAMAFLADALASGPVPSTTLGERAGEVGISQRTLERAKQHLGVRALKLGVKEGWAWQLPADEPGALGPEQSKRSPAAEHPEDRQGAPSDATSTGAPPAHGLGATANAAPADPPSATPSDFDPVAYQAAWTARRLGIR